MGHLENVETLAKERQQQAADERHQFVEKLTRWERMEARILDDLERQLWSFSDELKQRVKVYIRRKPKGGTGGNIQVAISTSPSWFRVPYEKCDIYLQAPHPHDDFVEDEFKIAYRVRTETSEDTKIREVYSQSDVLKILEEECAKFISKGKYFAYEAPEWYVGVGVFTGVVAALGCWLILGFQGWLGILLGWLPAVLVFWILRYGWVPLGILGILLVISKS